MIVADRPSKQARAKPHEIGAAKRSHEHLWMVENPGRYVLAETHLADIVANVEIPAGRHLCLGSPQYGQRSCYHVLRESPVTFKRMALKVNRGKSAKMRPDWQPST
jgi:hypothetical protein